MVVQHNLTAMNSNRMLGITTGTQAKSTEKLSSGYKINRAADDAAGLSISEKMRKQIRGLTQASLNAEDGISAVQTAEGALNEVQDMLQRMNELAVKAANGTMSENDRSYIQDEIKALETEIDRVAETTKFNETYLLKGDKDATAVTDYQYTVATKATLADGVAKLYTKDEATGAYTEVTTDDAIQTALDNGITLYSSKTDAGTKATSAAHETVDALTKGADGIGKLNKVGTMTGDWASTTANGKDTWTITITATEIATADTGSAEIGVNIGNEKIAVTGDAAGAASATNLKNALTTDIIDDIKANNDTIEDVKVETNAAGDVIFTVVAKTAGEYAKAAVSNADGSKTYAAGDKIDTADVANFEDNFYTAVPTTEKEAVAGVDYEDPVMSALYDKDGNKISANGLQFYHDEDGNYTGGLYSDKEATTAVTADTISDYVDDTNTKTAALTLKLHVGADATDNNQISVDLDAMSAAGIGVKDLKVDGADDTNARNAIETIKAALQQVSQQRSALGAVQNRLEHTIANLDNVVENTTAAESQIRDTDMATEMVKYSNNNILAQAGQAMLAQANQSNQGVLSLLG